VLLRWFHRREREELPNASYETSTALMSKPDKDTAKKENYRLIYLMNKGAKTLNKTLAN
jgi:hypothetical protein